MIVTRPRLSLLLPIVLASLLAASPRAEASTLLPSGSSCPTTTIEHPFADWGDANDYWLVPDGSFSDGGQGWTKSVAAVIADNRPGSSQAAKAAASLRIDAGGSATSPTVCVGLREPTMRFFARTGGGADASVRVDVVFEDLSGDLHSLRIGSTTPGGDWAPSRVTPIVANLLSLLSGERTPVRFRFTAQGSPVVIDDVYVDPYGKG